MSLHYKTADSTKEKFQKLIEETREKDLGYRFFLEEVKRNKWNINEKQITQISNELEVDATRIASYAQEINILNVSAKYLKALKKSLTVDVNNNNTTTT